MKLFFCSVILLLTSNLFAKEISTALPEIDREGIRQSFIKNQTVISECYKNADQKQHLKGKTTQIYYPLVFSKK